MPIHIILNYKDPAGNPYKVYGNDYKKGKILQRPKELSQATLKVMPCLDHIGQPTVPVVVVQWDPINKVSTDVGNAKACPLCWEIVKVVDGELLKSLLES